MIITSEGIKTIMPMANAQRISEFVESFNRYSDMFGINTPLRAAHYIAQVAHETGELRWLEELASGQQYEGRKDLGNTRQGDGRRFKGRGYLQTTGRANYQAYAGSGYCNGDLMSHPEWLAKQPGCQKASMFFWRTMGLNILADKDEVTNITRRINGGRNGLTERISYLKKAKEVFHIT